MPGKTIGADLNDGGCSFRLWAPHARKIRVLVQHGKEWDSSRPPVKSAPMCRNEDDYWTAHVEGVGPGTLYRYEIAGPNETTERLDPAARDVVHSGLTRHNRNASIVVTNEPYPWAKFKTPGFESFLIYQFHFGTFAGRNDHFNKSIATFRDVESKLEYIRELGFNAIEPLPVQEFAMDRSWGYNPASFFAPESAYGTPHDLQHFVDEAHKAGLAVIFDVVYNHAGPGDNVLWEFDGYKPNGGIYFEGGEDTHWGRGPAWQKAEVQDFFYHNARMYLEQYNADGLRFDATTQINGNHLRDMIWRLQEDFPDKYITAEHLPANPWITTLGNFDATWHAKTHHECQRALAGQDPVRKVESFLGWHGFAHSWNLIKYTLGSHDDVGDQENGDAEHGMTDWDGRHRYLIDQLGGRHSWTARAKCRLAWALNVTMPGTPMMFMGSECHMGAPNLPWGYWHDGHDMRGDHRFDWGIAGDAIGMQMRRLVKAANDLRWDNAALRGDTLQVTQRDYINQVIAFKRWSGNNVLLCVVNLGDGNFGSHRYGVATGSQFGHWTQVLCSQDAEFGGWDGAGNAFHEPETQVDGRIYVNLPKWSVVVFKLK